MSVGQGGFYDDTAYVVGVVGDVRFGTLDSLPVPDVYLSYYQSPRGRMMMFVRTAGDPRIGRRRRRGARSRRWRRACRCTTCDRCASAWPTRWRYARFSAMLLAAFAVVALALAALGTYGVISFGVSQRTKEIGIRVALGATRGNVVRLVVGQGIGLAVVGGGARALRARWRRRACCGRCCTVWRRRIRSTLVSIVALLVVGGDRGELDPGAARGGRPSVGSVAGVVLGLKLVRECPDSALFARTANGRFVVGRSAEER